MGEVGSQQPQSWHHGLVARWWSLFRRDGPEIAYFRRFVEQGQPALDVACGAGRLLCTSWTCLVATGRSTSAGDWVWARPVRRTSRRCAGCTSTSIERAGFADVEVRGGYDDRPPTAEDRFLVFVATRPLDAPDVASHR